EGEHPRELDRILGLETEGLVREADRIAVLDALHGVWLPSLGSGLGIVGPFLEPGRGEAVVEDAARITGRAIDVGDHRERRERRQMRWPRAAHEELADAGKRDPDHADLASLDPRLGRDR